MFYYLERVSRNSAETKYIFLGTWVFNWANNPGPLGLKNDYLPVQKCPPNPGLHSSHLPFLSHTFSFRLLSHLHFDSQKSPKKPGLHRPPIFKIKKLYIYTVKSGNMQSFLTASLEQSSIYLQSVPFHFFNIFISLVQKSCTAKYFQNKIKS